MSDSLSRQIAFSLISGVNFTTGSHILDVIQDEERFFSLSSTALGAALQLSSKITSTAYRGEMMARGEEEARFVKANNIGALYFRSEEYPWRLAECEDAPTMLYTLGQLRLDGKLMLGIVGTRHATPYGIGFVQTLIRDLCAMLPEKPVIVSGLAYGIDIAAHREALRCGCPTVAVLAHGLRTIYPSAHRADAAAIVEQGGLLVTEYTSSSPVHKGNFRARNRIIAGLSDGVLVAESAAKGGALITARTAADYNREVMALPGRAGDRYSEGCNSLIRSNIAALVASPADVVNQLGWPSVLPEGGQANLPLPLSPDDQAVVDYLTEHDDATINELAVKCGFSISKTMSLLVDMEFRGLLQCYPGSRYRLK